MQGISKEATIWVGLEVMVAGEEHRTLVRPRIPGRLAKVVQGMGPALNVLLHMPYIYIEHSC
jgi:hypothetical protein